MNTYPHSLHTTLSLVLLRDMNLSRIIAFFCQNSMFLWAERKKVFYYISGREYSCTNLSAKKGFSFFMTVIKNKKVNKMFRCVFFGTHIKSQICDEWYWTFVNLFVTKSQFRVIKKSFFDALNTVFMIWKEESLLD